MDFGELRSFGKSCELTRVTLTCQVKLCDGGVRFCMRPQFGDSLRRSANGERPF